MATSRLENIAKPASSEAMLVSSTGRRAEVRRSTSGCPVRSSHGAHMAKTRTETRKDNSVHCEVQPQTPPLEMPSSSAVNAMDIKIAPSQSKRAGVRTPDSGTTVRTSTSITTDIADAGPEHRLPTERLVDHARERKPHRTADAEGGAHQRDRAADLLRRQLVAHRRDADRDQRRCEALEHPGDDQQSQ